MLCCIFPSHQRKTNLWLTPLFSWWLASISAFLVTVNSTRITNTTVHDILSNQCSLKICGCRHSTKCRCRTLHCYLRHTDLPNSVAAPPQALTHIAITDGREATPDHKPQQRLLHDKPMACTDDRPLLHFGVNPAIRQRTSAQPTSRSLRHESAANP